MFASLLENVFSHCCCGCYDRLWRNQFCYDPPLGIQIDAEELSEILRHVLEVERIAANETKTAWLDTLLEDSIEPAIIR